MDRADGWPERLLERLVADRNAHKVVARPETDHTDDLHVAAGTANRVADGDRGCFVLLLVDIGGDAVDRELVAPKATALDREPIDDSRVRVSLKRLPDILLRVVA